MAAAPTVVCRSAATCGRSESITRTCAWLAKPATASRMIERVGVLSGDAGLWAANTALSDFTRCGGLSDASVDSQRGAGFLPREMAKPQ